uniref:THD domain-containing protein n=1 Tax=Neogobius melanostomus TaxID=47308 RepID=A0A8C6WI80_9GOBI
MAEGSCPQVFVVDHPINNAPPPVNQKPLWRRARKSLVVPLFGLIMFGLILEAIFIYRLYKRTEVRLVSVPDAAHVVWAEWKFLSFSTSLKVERPMAHLQGSQTFREDGVVEWVKMDEGFNNGMDYNTTGLVIKTKGFYYLYSKVHFQKTDNCAMVNHKVIKNTTKYGLPIDLLKSKRYRGNKEKEKDLWNSFLAGIFKLETGDHIYVKLDKGLYAEPDNVFGAFMLS